MKALNDKFMMQDVLAHLRDLMTQGGMAIQHSNCKNMRAVVENVTKRTTENQFLVFKYMNENNMYPIKNVTDQELCEVINCHTKQAN
ncbi:MAG: spore coat protein [Firmicutes bacterium]|nr:spore coat protein [Bacillota bacterium]